MTDEPRINLAELRRVNTERSDWTYHDDVLALIDAVEAAQELAAYWNNADWFPDELPALTALREALARFDFGEPS